MIQNEMKPGAEIIHLPLTRGALTFEKGRGVRPQNRKPYTLKN